MNGLGALVRAGLRRDRWMILWWSLGVTVLYVSQAVSVDGLYRTPEEFRRAAESMGSNTAFIAMAGPARALDTIGGQVTWQSTAFGSICVGLMSMFLVGRHTRAEEESGRDELIRAAPIDRHTPMLSGLLVALIANVVCGALVAVTLAAYPLAVADSVALGVGLTLVGWLFTAVALLAAQVASTTRAAYALTGVVIAAAYVLRAVGDVSAPALSWLSPIGWYQGMHAFSGLRWWPLLLMAGGAVVVGMVAHAVFDRRDFGAGLVPDRPGPTGATAAETSWLGFPWRLERMSVAGWTLGMFAIGAAYGTMGKDVGGLVGDSQIAKDLINPAGVDLTDGFYAFIIVTIGLIAGGYAVSSVLRTRVEEDEGRVEQMLATALPRTRWLGGYVVVTVVGVVLAVAAGGLGLALGFGLVSGEWARGARMGLDTLPYAAPVLVLAGIALLLYGVRARLAVLGWLALTWCAVVVVFGELLRIPQWLQDTSPFEHMAAAPAEAFRWTPFVVVSALALGLLAAGVAAFRHRDVH